MTEETFRAKWAHLIVAQKERGEQQAVVRDALAQTYGLPIARALSKAPVFWFSLWNAEHAPFMRGPHFEA